MILILDTCNSETAAQNIEYFELWMHASKYEACHVSFTCTIWNIYDIIRCIPWESWLMWNFSNFHGRKCWTKKSAMRLGVDFDSRIEGFFNGRLTMLLSPCFRFENALIINGGFSLGVWMIFEMVISGTLH